MIPNTDTPLIPFVHVWPNPILTYLKTFKVQYQIIVVFIFLVSSLRMLVIKDIRYCIFGHLSLEGGRKKWKKSLLLLLLELKPGKLQIPACHRRNLSVGCMQNGSYIFHLVLAHAHTILKFFNSKKILFQAVLNQMVIVQRV